MVQRGGDAEALPTRFDDGFTDPTPFAYQHSGVVLELGDGVGLIHWMYSS